MSDEFLGTGWAFPVETDARGSVRTADAEDDIRESIRLILGTAKGERVMRPEFGCEIHDHVFSAATPATLNLLESSVREALVQWEPRIDVEDVTARTDDENPNKVLIEIEYQVRTTNSLSNMVYPFYITEGDG
ncbi:MULTISPECIES: GPW/gp25 family protein [Natrinema]|uniref:Baseplate protein n=2 Tax=Natrinema TaxID=88723 RepID=A0A2A5QZQ2_9EURY|nr:MULTISPECIES: GPW/gp25 family protein [Natrinema]MBZ6495314.1 GPW/gp25 family protein [Natrinema longum]PCR92243.1 baseplate protein [Natrinema ejinorense]QSW86712.1 GPW/gp25 family protein [Natrinema longum]